MLTSAGMLNVSLWASNDQRESGTGIHGVSGLMSGLSCRKKFCWHTSKRYNKHRADPKCRRNGLRGLPCFGFLDQRFQCRLPISISLRPITFALVIASSIQTRTIQCDVLGMISDSAPLYVSTLLQSCIRDLVHIILFKISKQTYSTD